MACSWFCWFCVWNQAVSGGSGVCNTIKKTRKKREEETQIRNKGTGYVDWRKWNREISEDWDLEEEKGKQEEKTEHEKKKEGKNKNEVEVQYNRKTIDIENENEIVVIEDNV